MPFYYWQPQAELPQIRHTRPIRFTSLDDVRIIAQATHLTEESVTQRLREGHRAYIAWCGAEPAAYGWVATDSASIGELELAFSIPSENRYLWDFATLPAWRGQGIYPRLLQHILKTESHHAQHFWIAHASENHASKRGIMRAGFTVAGRLSFLKQNVQPALLALTSEAQSQAAAELLNIPLIAGDPTQTAIAPCWGCTIRAKRARRFIEPACWVEPCACIADETR